MFEPMRSNLRSRVVKKSDLVVFSVNVLLSQRVVDAPGGLALAG
jgi:hypothetical protein